MAVRTAGQFRRAACWVAIPSWSPVVLTGRGQRKGETQKRHMKKHDNYSLARQSHHVQVYNKRPKKHIKAGYNMLYIAYFIIVSGHNVKEMFCKIFYFSPIEGAKLLEQFVHTPKAIEPPTNSNSIAFGKSTSQRICPKDKLHKIG